MASESVKETFSGIITAEDRRKPFSDQHIAAILSGESIDIARRTVAQFREAMRILPWHLRRKSFANMNLALLEHGHRRGNVARNTDLAANLMPTINICHGSRQL